MDTTVGHTVCEVFFNILKQSTTSKSSSKTTLCHLVSRFWDVDAGRILIDGTDVHEYNYENLLEQISIIFQDVYLFEDTVRNNICLGKPDATDQEMIAVAKRACCHDFIMQLPDGYDTVLQEGGKSLSVGERQRISVARAMLKDAKIVIMDEATARVDPENEQKLTEALVKLVKGKTAIVIAHRLNTIKTADQILVMEQGRITEQGTHTQLRSNSKYRKYLPYKRSASLLSTYLLKFIPSIAKLITLLKSYFVIGICIKVALSNATLSNK